MAGGSSKLLELLTMQAESIQEYQRSLAPDQESQAMQYQAVPHQKANGKGKGKWSKGGGKGKGSKDKWGKGDGKGKGKAMSARKHHPRKHASSAHNAEDEDVAYCPKCPPKTRGSPACRYKACWKHCHAMRREEKAEKAGEQHCKKHYPAPRAVGEGAKDPKFRDHCDHCDSDECKDD